MEKIMEQQQQQQQPTLSDQLKAISRQALNLQMAVTSLADFCEAQAKEIEELKAKILTQAPAPETTTK